MMKKKFVACRICQKGKILLIDYSKYNLWLNREMLAQVAFSNLDAPDRELLISKTCGKCWDEMFEKQEAPVW